MTTACTDTKHPYYKVLSKLQNPLNFFQKDSERLAHVSLGEALDFTSFGGMNYVVWPKLDTKGMVEFVQLWMDNQRPKVQYERVADPRVEGVYSIKRKSEEFFYTWNRFHEDFPEALPFINHVSCPANENHRGTIRDLAGRIRCLHVDIQRAKPGFTTEWDIGNHRLCFQEDRPMDPREMEKYEDISDEEFEKYEEDMERFEVEKPEAIIDPCYAIISDVGSYLPLEKVLRRLNVNFKFSGSGKGSVFPFSGFDLANYVKAWWEQPAGLLGERRLFARESEEDYYHAFNDFQPVCD